MYACIHITQGFGNHLNNDNLKEINSECHLLCNELFELAHGLPAGGHHLEDVASLPGYGRAEAVKQAALH